MVDPVAIYSLDFPEPVYSQVKKEKDKCNVMISIAIL